jgi:6-phosphogluconolactonase
MLVGTYTGSGSTGIYVYRFDPIKGLLAAVDSIKSTNPSFLAISPDKKKVYAVNEEGTGGVSSFAFDGSTGRLSFLNRQSSKGAHPCYITVDATGKWVITGNYSSGNVAVLPVLEDGSLGEAVSVVQHKGSSTNTSRQQSPHVHATVLSPDNRFLYVPDLGIDRVMIYAFNDRTGKLEPASDTAAVLPAGSGPRHFTFHPNNRWAYVINELSGAVTSYLYKDGALRTQQSISGLPSDYSRSFTAADLQVSPDGKQLYVSYRDSANLLAIFRIHPVTGRLTLEGHQPVLGKTPRSFRLHSSGRFLAVANQNSGNIVLFRRRKGGMLREQPPQVYLSRPVCIRWVSVP